MPEKERKIEDFDRVLVVEGYGDLLFFAEVLEAVGKDSLVFIKEIGGHSGLRQKLEDFVSPKLLNSKVAIGFVFDADKEPARTRQSLEYLLSQLTEQKVVDGKWTAGNPKIGLFIVPGGEVRGEIETLVWHSWSRDPLNNAQKKCVEDYVACMRSNGQEARSPDKGLVGALLAVRNDDDPRLGPGARAKVFDLDRPELTSLREFFSGF